MLSDYISKPLSQNYHKFQTMKAGKSKIFLHLLSIFILTSKIRYKYAGACGLFFFFSICFRDCSNIFPGNTSHVTMTSFKLFEERKSCWSWGRNIKIIWKEILTEVKKGLQTTRRRWIQERKRKSKEKRRQALEKQFLLYALWKKECRGEIVFQKNLSIFRKKRRDKGRKDSDKNEEDVIKKILKKIRML